MNYLEEVNNWIEPIVEGKQVTVQFKRNGKIISTKQYNSQDVQQFYKMMENKDPIFFKGEELPDGVFSPDKISKIEDTKDGGKIIHIGKSSSRAMVIKRGTSITEGVTVTKVDVTNEIKACKSALSNLERAIKDFGGENVRSNEDDINKIHVILGKIYGRLK